MKSEKKIYLLFLVIALFFWNPATFYMLYADTSVYQVFYIQTLFWVTLILGLLFGFLLWKDLLSEFIRNTVFAFTFTGILFSLLVCFDAMLGKTKNHGFIFEPNTKARYQTVEFDYLAEINSLGLRDKELSLAKNNQLRILAFGDSWTYGWGVNLDNSWPKKLETMLRKDGIDLEIINCGQPGQYTTGYKKYIEKIVPMLQPDIVLVGVLQENDLAQLYERNYKLPDEQNVRTGSVKKGLKQFLKISFENIISSLKSKANETIEIQSVWKKATQKKLASLSYGEKLRFQTFDDSTRSLFKSGNLNPGILIHYLDFPDRSLIFNDPSNIATQFASKSLKNDFEQMKSICKLNNAQLIFLNLPKAEFTGHLLERTLGNRFYLEHYYENNKIDSIYRAVAEDLELPYLELTEHFKMLENKTSYFFKYDGHPNEQGYHEMALSIREFLKREKFVK